MAVLFPVDRIVEQKLLMIRSCLLVTPPDTEHALSLVDAALKCQQLDDQEMTRLRHEIAQYSELTKDLLLEAGRLRTQLEDTQRDNDRLDKDRADANRCCTAAQLELRAAQKTISRLEACLEDK